LIKYTYINFLVYPSYVSYGYKIFIILPLDTTQFIYITFIIRKYYIFDEILSLKKKILVKLGMTNWDTSRDRSVSMHKQREAD